MIAFLVAALIVGVALILWFRDPLPPLTASDLSAAEQRWNAAGPASYRMKIELEGARPGIVTIDVEDGTVTSMTRDGEAPEQRRTWDAWSVPGMFETLDRELELAADPEQEMNAPPGTRLMLRGEFDPELGYPRAYRRLVVGQAPEISWRVIEFKQ